MRRCCFLFLLLILIPVPGKAVSDHYHLVRILVRGSQRYSEADLVRATGLIVNSQITVDDLKNAAGRLGNSGLFASVQYLYKPSIGSDGIEADFDLVDAKQFLTASFENFVWFTPAELQAALHNALPLYNSILPASGAMPDDVVAVLSKLLASRNLPNQVSYIMQAELGKPPKAFLFKVENANLKIRETNFSGADHLDINLLKQTVAPLKGTEYLYSNLESFLHYRVIPLYLRQGYLKAAVAEIKPTAGENGAVDLDLTVAEGEQYLLGNYTWAGNTAITTEELSRRLHLKPGGPVDGVKLAEDLEEDRKLFGKFGHEAATVTSVPVFSTGLVSYRFDVVEGDLYRMGKLEVIAPDAQRQRIQSAWKLQEGATYDNTYIKQLMLQFKSELADKKWEWIAREFIDDHSKAVNVRLEVKVTK